MARDNSPAMRQANRFARKTSRQESYDRILIVSEGSKTEPNYFLEIRKIYRLSAIHLAVKHSKGTAPLQVVKHAEKLFKEGDSKPNIKKRAFEKIYAIFDRDNHSSYSNALSKAESLNNKLENDEGQRVHFTAITSIPCFELWLLLHFKEVNSMKSCATILQDLKKNYLPDYAKNRKDIFSQTKHHLDVAISRAEALTRKNFPYKNNLYTNVHRLVNTLIHLKSL